MFQPAESNLVQKRKSVTEDLISPKKSKLAELAETAVSIQNEKFLEKRKDLDSYTGCLPKVRNTSSLRDGLILECHRKWFMVTSRPIFRIHEIDPT